MNKQPKILLVDDEVNFLRSLKDSLELEEFSVLTAENSQQALELLEKNRVQIVITDIRMPNMSGIELLRQIKKRWPEIEVLMLTGYGSIEDAVTSVKLGAANYILKPVNVQDLITNIRSLTQDRTQRLTGQLNFDEVIWRPGQAEIIGESEPIRNVLKLIAKVANTTLPVLIVGESGTGKELVAHAIHRSSQRAQHSFVKINCAALPENLLESELFGYEAGAFTDAKKSKKGKFELAHHGTLFLDEIGDMPYLMQAKLLRVLEEKSIEHLGGNKAIEVDFRLISATNQNLEDLMRQGKFRQDLYYRLNGVTIRMPSLREIAEDIPRLVQYFIKSYCLQNHLPIPAVSVEAMRLLCQYPWPGNVRELRNVICRAIVLCEAHQIRPQDLPANIRMPHLQSAASKPPTLLTLEELEKEHIQRILRYVGGNKNKAAAILNIHRDTLYRKLKKYRIES